MVRLVVSARPAAIAAAVARCSAVAALSPGASGNVVTYLPGQRVVGVRKVLGGVAIHVVGQFGPTIAEIASQVRSAVTAVAPECERIDVLVDDLEILPDRPVTRPAGQPRGTGGTHTRGTAGGRAARGKTAMTKSAAAGTTRTSSRAGKQ